MLNVVNDELVVEEKGIYSVEKFLLARRLMYWQVYLHKTGLVAEQLLVRVLKRAKELVDRGVSLNASEAFTYFLQNKIDASNFNIEALKVFAKLDDYDIVAAMKSWMSCDDIVLKTLSTMIINRDLLQIKLSEHEISDHLYNDIKIKVKNRYSLTDEEINYFVFKSSVSNQAYDNSKTGINILLKNEQVVDVIAVSYTHLTLPTTPYV